MSVVESFRKLRELAETTEFSGIFGSAIKSKWFAFIMQHAGTYLFSASLALTLLKIGFDIEQYWKARNKNLSQKSGLLWNLLQAGAIATAVAGSLFFATLFFVPTSAIFVATMGLDTVRNVGLLVWNVYKLASLRFSLRNDLKDPLTRIKYKRLKNIYIDNILRHTIGAAIGLFCTLASASIFLFPKIGIVFTASTIVTIGAVKLSLSGLAGITAAAAMLSPIVIPLAVLAVRKVSNVCRPLSNKVISFFKKTDDAPELVSTLVKPAKKPKLVIDNSDKLGEAMRHKLNFDAYSHHSNSRELIIKLIDANERDMAINYLRENIDIKIHELTMQIENSLSWFQYRQADKRQQKIDALSLILVFLDTTYVIPDGDKKISTVNELIKLIEKKYPAVDDSFFLEESDTRNILNALKAYGERFPERGVFSGYLPDSNSPRRTG
jgi:hypothetical protein